MDAARQHELDEDLHPRPEPYVKVSYNGIDKRFDYHPEELVKVLLEHVIKAFGPLPNAHTLALFDACGQELNDGSTMKVAGVQPGDHLLLRPSAVKGG
jgi:hypothetical protein